MAQAGYEPMFHYLLEMHKDGKSLCKLELNIPCSIFRDVQANSLQTLEAMLVDYGKSHGLAINKPTPDATKGGGDATVGALVAEQTQ